MIPLVLSLPRRGIVAPLIARNPRQLGRDRAILDHHEVAALVRGRIPAVVVVGIVRVVVAEDVIVGPADRDRLDARATNTGPARRGSERDPQPIARSLAVPVVPVTALSTPVTPPVTIFPGRRIVPPVVARHPAQIPRDGPIVDHDVPAALAPGHVPPAVGVVVGVVA